MVLVAINRPVTPTPSSGCRYTSEPECVSHHLIILPFCFFFPCSFSNYCPQAGTVILRDGHFLNSQYAYLTVKFGLDDCDNLMNVSSFSQKGLTFLNRYVIFCYLQVLLMMMEGNERESLILLLAEELGRPWFTAVSNYSKWNKFTQSLILILMKKYETKIRSAEKTGNLLNWCSLSHN